MYLSQCTSDEMQVKQTCTPDLKILGSPDGAHGGCHKPQYWASPTMAIAQALSISRPPGAPLQESPTPELRGRRSCCQEPQVLGSQDEVSFAIF